MRKSNFVDILIRIFDIGMSFLGLIVLSPFFVVVSVLIPMESKGKVFFPQKRVGKYGKDFLLYKFRTMYIDSDKMGLITVGSDDPRITKIGAILRKFKIDEIPQLFNIFKGNMSFVGPRPEVRKYVSLYNLEQKQMLNIKPGLTDHASIIYFNENEILKNSSDPEKDYIEKILPEKLALNRKYIENYSVSEYFKIIGLTIVRLLKY
jgi:lipopolysaccharide/colanic/teichoic acid biosynthesis glycosyltransferase